MTSTASVARLIGAFLVNVQVASASIGFCMDKMGNAFPDLEGTGFAAKSDLTQQQCTNGGHKWCPLAADTGEWSPSDDVTIEWYYFSGCCSGIQGANLIPDPATGHPTCLKGTPPAKCQRMHWQQKLMQDLVYNKEHPVWSGGSDETARSTYHHQVAPATVVPQAKVYGGVPLKDVPCQCSANSTECQRTDKSGEKCLICLTNEPCGPSAVQLGINFFKIHTIDLKSSVLIFSSWVRQSWTDPRLAFDYQCYGGMDYFEIQGEPGSLENSLMWTPDIELYNNEHTMWRGSIGARLGMVYACWNGNPSRGGCGAVFFSRPGLLKALCKYKGLELFPNDELSCEMEISSWAIDGRFQDIIPRSADGGISWIDNPNSDAVAGLTAGSGFQDYTIKDITNKRLAVFYDCCPTSPFAEIVYNVVFSRSQQYYLYKLLIPSMLLTSVSFITFWMDPIIGERFQFNIVTILAMYMNEVTAMTMMPTCNEKVLMDYMSIVSMLFGIVSLVETAVVLFLYYQTAETWGEVLMPSWLRPLYEYVVKVQRANRRKARDTPAVADSAADATGRKDSTGSGGSERKKLVLKDTQNHHARRNLYRQAFFDIDQNFSGTLSMKELEAFGKFMLGQKWNAGTAEEFFDLYDTSKDGELDFDEFVAFCETCVLNVDGKDDIAHAERMVKGYLSFKERQAKALELRWKNRAFRVDYFARWLMPFGYFLSLVNIFSLDIEHFMEMNAEPDKQLNQYFYGLYPLCIAIGLYVVISAFRFVLKRKTAGEKLQDQCSVCLDIQAQEEVVATINKKAEAEGFALII